jgi:hypothetical protein
MLETHAILRALWEWITRQKPKPIKHGTQSHPYNK